MASKPAAAAAVLPSPLRKAIRSRAVMRELAARRRSGKGVTFTAEDVAAAQAAAAAAAAPVIELAAASAGAAAEPVGAEEAPAAVSSSPVLSATDAAPAPHATAGSQRRRRHMRFDEDGKVVAGGSPNPGSPAPAAAAAAISTRTRMRFDLETGAAISVTAEPTAAVGAPADDSLELAGAPDGCEEGEFEEEANDGTEEDGWTAGDEEEEEADGAWVEGAEGEDAGPGQALSADVALGVICSRSHLHFYSPVDGAPIPASRGSAPASAARYDAVYGVDAEAES